MKRTRKVTIEIEKREITVSISLQGKAWRSAEFEPSVSGPVRASSPFGPTASCPSCGSLWMLSIADAVASYRGGQLALSRGVTGGAIHVFQSGTGLWVCQNSLTTYIAKSLADSKETHE